MKMEKRQFRIGELAKEVGVERFVIRFWEKEFNIKSYRSPGGQRFYQEQDAYTFHQIKTLLYDRGFTIAGAKQHLAHPDDTTQFTASEKTTLEQQSPDLTSNHPSQLLYPQLVSLKNQLVKLKNLLS